jgi:hypothetical protein
VRNHDWTRLGQRIGRSVLPIPWAVLWRGIGDLGLIIRLKNAAIRASASGSGSSAFSRHALPRGVCWTIRGTAISAVCAALAGRLRRREVTMVMGVMYGAGGACQPAGYAVLDD